MLNSDLVAEESRRAGLGAGDQSRGLRQVQLEVLTRERRELGLDLLDLGLRVR